MLWGKLWLGIWEPVWWGDRGRSEGCCSFPGVKSIAVGAKVVPLSESGPVALAQQTAGSCRVFEASHKILTALGGSVGQSADTQVPNNVLSSRRVVMTRSRSVSGTRPVRRQDDSLGPVPMCCSRLQGPPSRGRAISGVEVFVSGEQDRISLFRVHAGREFVLPQTH